MRFSCHNNSDLFHENAKREIDDTYSYMGEIEKAYRLYEEYLESDSLFLKSIETLEKMEKFEKKIRINAGRKIYLNEACPCGSGKKYNKCCGRN